MIRFLKHSEIDKDRWNLTIQKSLNTTIFADFDFLSISSPNWCALVEDDYKSVMPLPVRRKFSINYIYNPFFSNRLGIFSKEIISDVKVKEFFDHIPSRFRQVDLILNRQIPTQLIEDKTIRLISHSLNLNRSHEEISQGYSQNTTRNIKYAQKYCLEYIEGASVRDIIRLFQNNKGKQSHVNYKSKDYLTLMKMSHWASRKGLLESVGVTFEGKLIAGALFLRDNQRIWFWFSGRDNKHADKKTMFLLLNEYILRHCETPLELDFNGSMNENVARLYKGFGGIAYHYKMIISSRDIYFAQLMKLYKSIFRN